ncbi:MAG: DNA cytosine methyltransferase [Candidatus Dormiibacterota bacterium]
MRSLQQADSACARSNLGSASRATPRRPQRSAGSPTARRTAIDLFAGAGGSTQGLKLAGFNVLGAVEWDSQAADSYQLNHPEVALDRSDLGLLSPLRWSRSLGLRRGELDLLSACPPCQGFSTLGTRVADDPRNDLITTTWKFIRFFRPKAWLVENVPGAERDVRTQRLVHLARRAGYGVERYVLDAADIGVPQHRRRLILVGLRDADPPRSLVELFLGRYPLSHVPVRDALAILATPSAVDPLDRGRRHSPLAMRRIQALEPGGSRHDLPPELQLDCHRRLGKKGAGSVYGRIDASKPAPTMTTRCTTPSCGRFVHPVENRGLTLREAATLQTFPRSYRFSGTYDSIEKQIGNAVPVGMAQVLAAAIHELLST